MKRIVLGYVGTIGGTVLSLLTLASLGDAHPNRLATTVLFLMAVAMLGVGWYGLRTGRPETAGEAS